MKYLKCPCCGAPLKRKDLDYCNYCGSYLQEDYVNDYEEKNNEDYMESFDRIEETINDAMQDLTRTLKTSTKHVRKTVGKSNINWFLLIILFMIAPPFAIFYLIVKVFFK